MVLKQVIPSKSVVLPGPLSVLKRLFIVYFESLICLETFLLLFPLIDLRLFGGHHGLSIDAICLSELALDILTT